MLTICFSVLKDIFSDIYYSKVCKNMTWKELLLALLFSDCVEHKVNLTVEYANET